MATGTDAGQASEVPSRDSPASQKKGAREPPPCQVFHQRRSQVATQQAPIRTPYA